jgi:hypothetical protein
MITHTGTGMGAGWMPQVTLVVTCWGKKRFLAICSTGFWTQSLTLARQVLYHFCYSVSPRFLVLKIIHWFSKCMSAD